MWMHPDLERCLCWNRQTNDWCEGYWDQCENYWQSVYGAAAPGVIAAVVMAIFVAVYYTLRVLSCLKCVTCCVLSKGSTSDEGGMKSGVVVGFRKTMYVVILMMAVSGGLCISWRVGDIRDGMQDVNDNLAQLSIDMRKSNNAYYWSSLQLAAMLNANDTIMGMIKTQADDVYRWIKDMDDARSQAMSSAWLLDLFIAIPLGFMVLLVILSVLRVHRVLPEFMVFVTIFFALAVCIIQSSFGVLSVVRPDVCDDYNNVAHVAFDILHSELKCDGSPDAAMGKMFITTHALNALYANGSCNATVCDGDNFRCTENCSSVEAVTFMIYETSRLVNETARGECVGQCTIAECATNCSEGETKTMALQMLKNNKIMTIFNGLMVESVYPLASCELFEKQIKEQQDNICWTSWKAKVSPYAVSASFMAFLSVMMVVYYGLLNCIYERQERSYGSIEPVPYYVAVHDPTRVPIIGTPCTYGTTDTVSKAEAPAVLPINESTQPTESFTFDPVEKPAQ
eukprot:TRINITY_DN696_c0_g1_i1.p1 TRINITY_DN696_c0_g1~~TRINITY_DN696_c0_g1_i1.p1  ORF type:complete len:511 (+),score=133.62 TRINITY_DN696_c0_g1_i1:62-1594(+)